MIKNRDERIEFLHSNLWMTNKELAFNFGVKEKSFKVIMRRLGIRRPQEMIDSKTEMGRKKGVEAFSKIDKKIEKNGNWKGGISTNHYHYKKIQYKRYPERVIARIRVNQALKKGKIKKGICFCGEKQVFAHHRDYKKPLDVIWLCRKHHREEHMNRN